MDRPLARNKTEYATLPYEIRRVVSEIGLWPEINKIRNLKSYASGWRPMLRQFDGFFFNVGFFDPASFGLLPFLILVVKTSARVFE